MAVPPRIIILSITLFAIAGCVQQKAQPDGGPRVVRTERGASGGSDVPTGPTPPNVIDAIDPVGSRLQDLGGLLIQYHVLNKRMPKTLDEVRPLAAGEDLFTDPKTGEPFVYLPQATRMSPGDTRVVLYAPTPDPSGRYQGILMRLGRGSQITAIWVVSLSEIELQGQIGGQTGGQTPAPPTQPTR